MVHWPPIFKMMEEAPDLDIAPAAAIDAALIYESLEKGKAHL
jgi:hypothetical protein